MWQIPKLREEFRAKHEIGSQPMECAVAYEMGRGCPRGRELDLLLGLDSFWQGMLFKCWEEECNDGLGTLLKWEIAA